MVFVYSRDPIDYWTGWLTEREYLCRLVTDKLPDGSTMANVEGAFVCVCEYMKWRDAGMTLAYEIGWEGDVRGDQIFVTGVPSELGNNGEDDEILIAWKQENNGHTFIISPFELPWLKDLKYPNWHEARV